MTKIPAIFYASNLHWLYVLDSGHLNIVLADPKIDKPKLSQAYRHGYNTHGRSYSYGNLTVEQLKLL